MTGHAVAPGEAARGHAHSTNFEAGDRAARPFPWDAALHAGLFLLRLPPELFWRLSLPEFCAMTGGVGAPERLARAGLERLMARFPDGAL